MSKAIMIHPGDNTATLFGEAAPGQPITVVVKSGEVVLEITARELIPVGHKIALREIREGEQVIKYGESIGVATRRIQKGEHVHVQNVVGLTPPARPI